jgi:hypothetical protein
MLDYIISLSMDNTKQTLQWIILSQLIDAKPALTVDCNYPFVSVVDKTKPAYQWIKLSKLIN